MPRSASRVSLAVRFFVLSSLFCLLPCAIRAQLVTGTVTGTVTDQSGSLVAGASVRLINTGTGVTQQATSDEGGNFRFLLLQPGVYTVEASKPGFKMFRREGTVVESARSLAVPVMLALGSVSETVEVVAGTPLLEPNTSTLGAVVDLQKVKELPLNGRNPMDWPICCRPCGRSAISEVRC
jgi:hypothetical protein